MMPKQEKWLERYFELIKITTKLAHYQIRSKGSKKNYLQPITHEYLKWSRLSAGEKNAYNERLSTLQTRQFGIPRLVNWNVFEEYGCEDALMDMMKIEYMNEDGYLFLDRSWENVFSNGEKFYREWFLKFYSKMYFNRKVNRNKIMTEKCIWFRLCGKEHVYTLIEFAVLLGLYCQSEVQHSLFETHFVRLMTNDKGFNYDAYWNRTGQPTTEKKKLADIRELAKCLEPVKSESWDDKMFRKLLDRRAKKLSPITPLKAPPQASNLPGGEPSGLNSSARPSYGGNSIVLSSCYEIRGSSRGVQDDDDDMSDQFICSEDCVESDDDMDD
ncbi:hypothetical protein Tco_0692609 [Tanacetum coccineum]